jgi:hypothetical protein
VPNRWIKQAYCTSSRIHAASPEARDLWVRLLLAVDDHGYYYGDPQLIASTCFPLQPNARKCEQLLAELEAARLIVRYEHDGKAYLGMCQWAERARSKPKFPAPPDEVCKQLQAGAGYLLTGAGNGKQLRVPTTTTTTTNYKKRKTTPSAPNDISFDAEHGVWSGIEETDLAMWAEAYPAVDLKTTIAAAGAWLRANPKNLKSNYRRFLANWLKRTQDQAPAQGGGRAEKRVAL